MQYVRFSPMPVAAILWRLALIISMCALSLSPATAQKSMGGGDAGAVTSATFTSGVTDGAPVDYRQQFDTNTPVVYYYTEIAGLQGQKVTHRWKLEGKVMKEVVYAQNAARPDRQLDGGSHQPAWRSPQAR